MSVPSSNGTKGIELNLLLLLGAALLLGLVGGKLFQAVKIPRVVGYISVGVVLGSSFTNVIPLDLVSDFSPLTNLALAFIGFMVGSELKKSVFQRFGRQLIVIMLVEGLAAFALVTFLVIALTHNGALGILLGALASATAPAATVDVLWEYKSKGPLTTTILGIVALDDGLALILFGFCMAFARVMLEGGSFSLANGLVQPLIEIVGALALGTSIAASARWALRRLVDADDVLVLSIGLIVLVAGLSERLDLSLILSEMALGATLVNFAPNVSRRAFERIKGFTPPIYIVFFILVGAKLQVGLLGQIGGLGLLYVAGRTLGKMFGAWLGGVAVKAEPAVRKYLGFALFSQAGVAIGLALAVAQEFSRAGPAARDVGALVVNVIAATTFLVQIIGPPFVKFAISRAGEIPGS